MRRSPRAAFTLLEIMLAVALAGMILVALNTFIFSMGELWGRNASQRLFDQHVNAVTRFLQHAVDEATYPSAAAPASTPVSPQSVTSSVGLDNLLTFELPEGSPIFTWLDRPLPEVLCSLQLRPDGLYLLWQSRLETGFGTTPPREMLLTPYATAMGYDYYSATTNSWATQTAFQTDPATGLLLPPGRLRLTFTYGRLVRQTVVVIPATLATMPNF